MSKFWLRIKIWSKMTIIAAVIVYVILFTYFNAQQSVDFWYWFHHQPHTNLLLLALCAFFAGIIVTLLVRTTYRTLRQVQDAQHRGRVQRLDKEMADMRTKAAMLRSKPEGGAAPSPVIAPPDEEST